MLLDEIREASETERERQEQFEHNIRVCTAAGCASCRSDSLLESLQEGIKERSLDERVCAKPVGCMGLCSAGALVSVDDPGGVLYQKVQPEDSGELIDSLGGTNLSRLVCDTNVPFFSRQKKVVLENSGVIDPTRLEDYLAVGGYQTLAEVLTEWNPMDVTNEVIKSGLRGRGGAGYPAGLKWSTVYKAVGEPKFVVCTADEGDPGAFMDRSVLESDPHRVLEGMTIAAYAVGAARAYIYIRAEYPLAIERLKKAIRQSEKAGFLGKDICGSPFDFRIDIRLGAGAFVCGEETALIHSIEGGRGTPRPRPPYSRGRGYPG